MDRAQFSKDLQLFRSLAMEFNQHLQELSEEDLGGIAQALPDPLLKKIQAFSTNREPLSDLARADKAFSDHQNDVQSLVTQLINSGRGPVGDELSQLLAELSGLIGENRRQKALLDAIFEADPSGLALLTGPDLQFAYVNPAYRYLVPNPEINPIGQPFQQIWQTEDAQAIQEKLAIVLDSGCPFQQTVMLRQFPDGTRRYFTLQARRIEWDDHLAVLLILWDITEQKAAEQALRESEDRFRTLADNISQLVWMADPHGNRVWFNQRWYDFTGTTFEDVKGWGWKKVHHPDYVGPVLEKMYRCFERGEAWEDSYPLRGKDGQYRWFLSVAMPIRDEQGKVVRWFGTNTDITEEREAEQALRESEARERTRAAELETLMDAAPAMIWISRDSKCHQMIGNRYGNRFLSLGKDANISKTASEAEVSMQPYRNFKDGHEIPVNELPMQVAAATGKPAHEYEFDLVFNDGSIRTVLGNVEPLIDDQHQPYGAVAVFVDITERKAAEQRISTEKEWFRTTLASIGDAVITSDPQGCVTFLNPIAEQLTGWSAAEAAGQPMEKVFSIYNELTGKPTENPVAQVLECGTVVGLANHTVLKARDGRTIPIEDSAAPIRDSNGQTLGVVMVFHNVTEKREAERALRESEQRFQIAFDNMPDVLVIYDQDNRIKYINWAAIMLTGLPPSDLIGRKEEEIWPEEIVQAWRPTITRTFESRTIQGLDFEFQAPHMEKHNLHMTSVPLVAENDEVREVMVIYHDLTEIKHTEAELRRALSRAEDGQRLLDAMMEYVPEGITIAEGPDVMIRRVSRYGQQLLGGPHDQRSAKQVSSQWPVLETDGVTPVLEENLPLVRAIRRGEVVKNQDILQINADGKQLYLSCNAAPIRNSEGTITGGIVAWRDLTERKKTEETARERAVQIELQRRLLEQREQERLQIARDLHDGPMQELLGARYALKTLMSSDACTPQVIEQLQAIETSIQQQVSELRAYAGLLRPPTLSKFGLGKAIRSHIDTFSEKNPGLTIRFEKFQDEDQLPEEFRLAIFRIFQESLTNIAKHANASEANVSLEITETYVRLSVIDNGGGFELPYDWLALARQGHLGLVGMRERAEAIGGELEIISHPGGGTTLQLFVPINPTE